MPGAHLLVVDDDRLSLATTTEGLRALGYRVTAADGARQALQHASEASFDLALMDIRMSGLSGIELAHVLHGRHGLRCLYLSAFGERDEVAQAVREGGLGYLVKPVDPPALMPAIETALARAQELDALLASKRQLEQALTETRQTSVAVGIVMASRRLSQQAAFAVLREEARSQRRKLAEHCVDVIEQRQQQAHG